MIHKSSRQLAKTVVVDDSITPTYCTECTTRLLYCIPYSLSTAMVFFNAFTATPRALKTCTVLRSRRLVFEREKLCSDVIPSISLLVQNAYTSVLNAIGIPVMYGPVEQIFLVCEQLSKLFWHFLTYLTLSRNNTDKTSCRTNPL